MPVPPPTATSTPPAPKPIPHHFSFDLFPHRIWISSLAAVIAVGIYIYRKHGKLSESDLATAFVMMLYVGGAFEGVFFLYSGFNPSYLKEMPESGPLIVIAATLMIIHAWIEIRKRFVPNDADNDSNGNPAE